jgi:hypothetical protein
MYIEKVPNRNSPPAVLRPDSYREFENLLLIKKLGVTENSTSHGVSRHLRYIC